MVLEKSLHTLISLQFSTSAITIHTIKLMERDRISELSDSILLHIMSFMNTKYAVQTCVLSKRWNHLCKLLINLIYSPIPNLPKKNGVERFKKFATWVLSTRDHSCSVHSLRLHLCWTDPELLDKIIKYSLYCNVQQLILDVYSGFRPDFESLPLIFCSQSLTSLKLCIAWNYAVIVLPKSLHLPVLKNLHLQCVIFTASDNDSAQPFSNCHLLNTLVLRYCSLHGDAQMLCISNSTLSSFTIYEGQTYQILLSTPNLSYFTIRGSASHQLFSRCNLSFLDEVNIDVSWDGSWAEKSSIISSNIMRWLQVLANVKKLTFSSWYPFQIMLHDFSNPLSMRPESPSLVRLESLKVIKHFFVDVSDEKVNTLVEYLLQGSPMAKVDIITRD